MQYSMDYKQNKNYKEVPNAPLPVREHEDREALATKKQMFIVFLIGLIIGFGSFWLWDGGTMKDRGNSVANEEVKDTDTAGDVLTGSGEIVGATKNSVIISNQTAGSAVTIKKAVLSENAWVAIHESIDGAPGSILGAARFDAGEYAFVTVDLLREIEAGKTYFAALRKDDGVIGFDINTDIPITTDAGDTVLVSFTTLTPSPSGQ